MRPSSEARSADVWARTFPRAFRLAYLLVGDGSIAERIAERTFIRLHVRYRDVVGTEGLDEWTTRTVVRLSRSRARRRWLRARETRSTSGLGGLERLRFRPRAALVLSVYDNLSPGSLAHALDCSPGGAIALISAAEKSLARAGVEPPGRHDLVRLVADLRPPALTNRTLRRASRSRALASAATVVLLLASGVTGFEALTVPEKDRDEVPDIPAPELRDASESLIDLRSFAPPGWCPTLPGTSVFKSQTEGAVADTALRFDIALARGGYRQTIKALRHPSVDGPPIDRWPHHRSSSGLGVVQIRDGSTDPDLVLSCGGEVAGRTLEVGVLQRRADAERGDVIAFYLVLVDGAWRVWGSSGL